MVVQVVHGHMITKFWGMDRFSCAWCSASHARELCYYVLTDDSLSQGPVVRTLVSPNPGLNFNLGFVFFLSKALSRITFSILFRVSNHQIVGKENLTEFAF